MADVATLVSGHGFVPDYAPDDVPSFDTAPGIGIIQNPPIGQVTLATANDKQITCWVNGVAKVLPGTFGGYSSTQRSGRRARTTYQGVDVAAMTVPLLFDGWSTNQPTYPAVTKLSQMAGPSGPGDLTPPQPVYVIGAVLPVPSGWWVIQALEPGDNVLARPSDGAYLRQDFAMTLVQPPDDAVIITNGKRYVVRPGDTLTSIASRQLGDASKWRKITSAKTGKHFRDPTYIKVGQVVKLP